MGKTGRVIGEVIGWLALVAILLFVGWRLLSAATGQVTLRWTAPGDDGTVGRAAEYDVRWARDSITDLSWSAATQVTGEPVPDSAGKPQLFVVQNLPVGESYFFALKTRDEAFNWSGLSNVARTFVPDQEKPGTTFDLRGTSP